MYSTQLKFIRNRVARRLKDTHENNGDKQTDKTIKKQRVKKLKTMNEHVDCKTRCFDSVV